MTRIPGLAAAATIVIAAVLAARPAAGAPVQTTLLANHRMGLEVQRTKASGEAILKEGLKVNLVPGPLQWDPVPGTGATVAVVAVRLENVPIREGMTVLLNGGDRLKPDPREGYLARLPLFRKESVASLTIIGPSGGVEEWEIRVHLALRESAVFVDESCGDYRLRIKEERRPADPNLLYVGCRPGAEARELTLDVVWADVPEIELDGRPAARSGSAVSVPLESRRTSLAQLSGKHPGGFRSQYAVSYQPFVPPPYELWAGLALFSLSFEQSNFPAKFKHLSTAFLAQAHFRPEDIDLSFLLRAMGTVLPLSQSLDPDLGYKESASSYMLDFELRYLVLDRGGWRLQPSFGGWLMFMNVESRGFGVQRIINPVLGLAASFNVTGRDRISLGARFVPLQTFFNPLKFTPRHSYFELELTYVQPIRQRNRWFATASFGSLNSTPEGRPSAHGTYLVLGGGYGW